MPHTFSDGTTTRMYCIFVHFTKILTYPVIPLHNGSHSSLLKLQRVQNAATRFICNSYYPEMVTSRELHRRCNLLPLNLVLHQRARQTWMTIQARGYTMLQHLDEQEVDRTHKNFPRSKEAALGPEPEPIFS